MPLHTDEVRIEKFSLDEKQRQLRQAFVTRFVLIFVSVIDYYATTATATSPMWVPEAVE